MTPTKFEFKNTERSCPSDEQVCKDYTGPVLKGLNATMLDRYINDFMLLELKWIAVSWEATQFA